MNMSVYNGYFNGNYCNINSSTGSVIKNHNLIGYTNKRDAFSTNRYLRENNGLPDYVDIDDMSPEFALNQCINME